MGAWSWSSGQWVSTSPYITLNVTTTANGVDKDTVSWSLVLNRPYNISSSASKSWSVTVAGQTWSGSTAVGGSGSKTISSGSKTVNKNTSTQYFSASATLNIAITWSGSYKGSISASGSFYSDALPSYTVSYNANGGSGAPGNQTKWYGSNITLSSAKPTRTGYTFAGWATSSSGSVAYQPGATYSSNASVTLYAKWTAITYTVSYNANGGSGAPGTQTKTYGVNLTLSSTKPTKTNYNFKGWATSASGAVTYQPGASYTANAAITLYAVWELAYTKPRITNITVKRCNSSGTASDQGTYVSVSFSWATDKTVSSIQLKYKASTTTTWSSATTITGSGTSGTVTNKIIGAGTISIENSYDISIYVADTTGNNTVTATVGAFAFPIDFLHGGKGAAFGKPASQEGILGSAFTPDFAPTLVGTPNVIANSTDLNTLKTPGNYGCKNATAATLVNCPTNGVGFRLVVGYAYTDSEYLFQEITEEFSGSKYFRRYYVTKNEWTTWRMHMIARKLDTTDNLNNVLVPGTYYSDGGNPNTAAGIYTSSFTLEVLPAGTAGQLLQRITRCHKTVKNAYERLYYSSSWGDWTAVGGFTYSTSEQWTGEYWIDGKKIYTKTLRGSIKAFATGNINHGVTDIGSYRTFDFNNSFWMPNGNSNLFYHLGRWESSTAFLCPGSISNTGYMNLAVGSSWASDNTNSCYITIRYTKTTD